VEGSRREITREPSRCSNIRFLFIPNTVLICIVSFLSCPKTISNNVTHLHHVCRKETVESPRPNEDGLQQTTPILHASAKAVASRGSSASPPPSSPRMAATSLFLSPARRRAQTAGLSLATWASPPSILQWRAASRGGTMTGGARRDPRRKPWQAATAITTSPSHSRSSSSSRRSCSNRAPPRINGARQVNAVGSAGRHRRGEEGTS
jgi:hypothetical protein